MTNEFNNIAGFQWDEGNIDKNLVKHNVQDWECEQIFFNEPLLVLEDPAHSAREHRWAALGTTDAGRRLVVVYTRRKELLRVISARDMARKERRFYEENG
ncbi:MAG TPA: BrnT family toxin [Candidatus Hydrogenedentes bacterium]|nr:BrnT family toxin [Candidatus Hydrogenedentota bacterium]HIJ73613.1 BrnT family toxin [Candidatus Hydrogenedentota bacterium]